MAICYQANKPLVYCDVFRENALNFRPMPTLQHMAAVKFITHMWKDKELFVCDQGNILSAKMVEDLSSLLINELRNLNLPESILSRLIFVAKGTSVEILKWAKMQTAVDHYFNPWKYAHLIQWSSRGRIDYSKTATLILGKKNLSEEYHRKARKMYFITNVPNLSKLFLAWFYNRSFLETTIGIIPGFRRSNDIGSCFTLNKLELLKRYLANMWAELTVEGKRQIFNMNFSQEDVFCWCISMLSEQQKEPVLLTTEEISFVMKDWLWQEYLFSFCQAFINSSKASFDSSFRLIFLLTRSLLGLKLYRESLVLLVDKLQSNELTMNKDLVKFAHSLRFDVQYSNFYNELLNKLSSSSFACHCFLNLSLDELFQTSDSLNMTKEFNLFKNLVWTFFGNREELYQDFYNSYVKNRFIEFLFQGGSCLVVDKLMEFLLPHDMIETSKEEISHRYHPFCHSCFSHLYHRRDTERLDYIFSYVFSHDWHKIRSFKTRCLLSLNTTSLIHHSILGALKSAPINQKPITRLISVVNWVYDSQEDLDHFKGLLQKVNASKFIIESLLEPTFTLVDEFLSWCFYADSRNITRFKNSFAICSAREGFSRVICYSRIDLASTVNVRNFCSWFELNPDLFKEIRTILFETQEISEHLDRKKLTLNLLTSHFLENSDFYTFQTSLESP